MALIFALISLKSIIQKQQTTIISMWMILCFDILELMFISAPSLIKQYMMSNKQLGRNLLAGQPKSPFPLQPPRQSPSNQSEPSTSVILNILANIQAKKFNQAYTESSRLKLTTLQEVTRIAYEHSLMKYLLHTRDKIVQINPQQLMLTQSGMLSLRTLGQYREEAGLAKVSYVAIAENIKKLIHASTYYQCTLVNRQELADIKASLFSVFQEMRNRQRQTQSQAHTYASSEATDRDKEKSGITNECKETLLDIISLIMPTQTLRTSMNRQKSLQELATMAKDHIKQAFINFKNELELVQSRAHFCEKNLESERRGKLQKDRQLNQLKQELISSQRYIEDLEGLKAATQMQNLGLHSKIRSSRSDDLFQCQVQRLRSQNEDLENKIAKMGLQLQKVNEQLQENIHEQQRFEQQMNSKLEKAMIDAQEQKQHLLVQLQAEQLAKQQLEATISQKQTFITHLTNELNSHSLRIKQLIFQMSSIRAEKQQLQEDMHRLQGLQLKNDDYNYQISKLQEQVQCLQSQIAHFKDNIKQEEEQKANNDALIDQLHKTIEENKQERQEIQAEVEAVMNENHNYCIFNRQLQDRVKEMQEQIEYLTAQKQYYQKILKETHANKQEKAINTIFTLDDLKQIKESIATFSQRQSQLEELYYQNKLLRSQLDNNQRTIQQV